MKNNLPIIIVFLFALVLTGCVSSGSSSERGSSGGSQVTVDNPNISLTTYLSRLSGVRVLGSGSTATINVREASSSTILTDPRPLIILDGVNVGRDFSRIYGMVNMNNVKSIRVIHSSRASLLHGHEGSNGVIEILYR